MVRERHFAARLRVPAHRPRAIAWRTRGGTALSFGPCKSTQRRDNSFSISMFFFASPPSPPRDSSKTLASIVHFSGFLRFPATPESLKVLYFKTVYCETGENRISGLQKT